MSDRQLGVCLLSCVRHQRTYAPLLAAHPDLRIVCVADEPDAPEWMHEVNRTFAERYQVPYLSVADALARPDVDLASICSEPTRHARLALQAVHAGVHALVDKPMAISVAEAQKIQDSVETSSIQLTYMHHLFNENVMEARKLIDSGRLAVPWAFHMDIIAGGGLDPVAVEDFEMVVNPALSGGGELMNWLNYAIGTLRYLTGLEIESVYAQADTFFFEPHRQYGVEDFGIVALHFERDVTATITAGRIPAKIDAVPGSFTLRGQGLYGMFAMDQFRPRIVIEKPRGEPQKSILPLTPRNGVDLLIDDFVLSILDNRQPRSSATDGLAIARVIDAVYMSVQSGERKNV